MHEVKLYVATAPDLLPGLLCWSIGQIFAAVEDGHIGFQKGVAHFGDKIEPTLGVALGGRLEVVKKQPANSSGFAPVGVVEILVTALLVFRIKSRVMGITGLFAHLVKVLGVLFK